MMFQMNFAYHRGSTGLMGHNDTGCPTLSHRHSEVDMTTAMSPGQKQSGRWAHARSSRGPGKDGATGSSAEMAPSFLLAGMRYARLRQQTRSRPRALSIISPNPSMPMTADSIYILAHRVWCAVWICARAPLACRDIKAVSRSTAVALPPALP